MCDGCSDVTYWKDKDGMDKLVWSYGVEEPMKYGDFLRLVPKNEETLQASKFSEEQLINALSNKSNK